MKSFNGKKFTGVFMLLIVGVLFFNSYNCLAWYFDQLTDRTNTGYLESDKFCVGHIIIGSGIISILLVAH